MISPLTSEVLGVITRHRASTTHTTIRDTNMEQISARRAAFLQIKNSSLAAEARIIRAKEQRILKGLRKSRDYAALKTIPTL